MGVASIIVDPGMARALISGRKRQLRQLAAGALAQCAPGDRIAVREACIPGRIEDGRAYSTVRARAEFVTFPDGWRRHRDGSGHAGRPPVDIGHRWIAATHMPRWACRMTLLVEWTRTEPLRAITTGDIRAEGALMLPLGLLCRWPRPIPGIHPGARRAFAAYWNINHGTAGERWEDNPLVTVLGFRVEPN
jgi:hypothetical protein